MGVDVTTVTAVAKGRQQMRTFSPINYAPGDFLLFEPASLS